MLRGNGGKRPQTEGKGETEGGQEERGQLRSGHLGDGQLRFRPRFRTNSQVRDTEAESGGRAASGGGPSAGGRLRRRTVEDRPQRTDPGWRPRRRHHPTVPDRPPSGTEGQNTAVFGGRRTRPQTSRWQAQPGMAAGGVEEDQNSPDEDRSSDQDPRRPAQHQLDK